MRLAFLISLDQRHSLQESQEAAEAYLASRTNQRTGAKLSQERMPLGMHRKDGKK